MQGFVNGRVAAVGKVFRGKEGDYDIWRHAEPIEGLPIFRSINLNGEPEAPSIGQSAVENFGEHALCVRADADDMRLAAENSHGECFSRANAIGASEQNNGTAEPWSGASMDNDGLGRCSMFRITNVIAGDL